MVNFTVPNSYSSNASSDPANLTILATPTPGNLLVAIGVDRSSNTLTSYECSDAGSGEAWEKRADLSNAVGGNEANTRMNMAVFTRIADGSEGGILSIDDGTGNSKRSHYFEIEADAAYNFEFVETAINGSGASHIDGLSSGTANPTGTDIFEVAIVGMRNSTDEPTYAGISFDAPHTTGKSGVVEGGNGRGIVAAINGASSSAGAKSASVNADGSGTEGIACLLTFRDSAGGGSTVTGSGALNAPAASMASSGSVEGSVSGSGALASGGAALSSTGSSTGGGGGDLIDRPVGPMGSADFKGSLDAGWSFVNQGSPFTMAVIEDDRLEWTLGASDSQDPGTGSAAAGLSSRVQKAIGNVDFEVTVKMDRGNAYGLAGFNGFGFYVGDTAAANSIRVDLYSRGDESRFRWFIADGSSTEVNTTAGLGLAGRPTFMRLTRSGTSYTVSASWDGTTFTDQHTWTSTLTVENVGFYAYHINPTQASNFVIDYIHLDGHNLPSIDATPVNTTVLDEDFSDLSNWHDDSTGSAAASVASNTLTLTKAADTDSARVASVDTYGPNMGLLFKFSAAAAYTNLYFGAAINGIQLVSAGRWANQYSPDVSAIYEAKAGDDTYRLLGLEGYRNDGIDNGYWHGLWYEQGGDAVGDTLTDPVWVRMEYVGPIIRFKHWRDGDPEPGTWTSESVDEMCRVEGRVGFVLSQNDNVAGEAGSVDISDVEIYEISAPAGADVTGTGALQTGGAFISATGERSVTGSGALAPGGANLSASGVRSILGTGAVSIGGPSMAATGERSITGSGALAAGGSSITATGEREIFGDADLNAGGVTLSAAGERSVTGSGEILAGPAALRAAGDVSGAIAGTGALVPGGAALDASGVRTTNGSGALAPGGAVLSGAGNLQGQVGGSGALTAGAALLAASGTRSVTGQAALAPGGAQLSASGERIVPGTGVLAAGAAQILASGGSGGLMSGSGQMAVGGANIAAVGERAITGAAALAAGSAALDAAGGRSVVGTASLSVGAALLLGTALSTPVGALTYFYAFPGETRTGQLLSTTRPGRLVQ